MEQEVCKKCGAPLKPGVKFCTKCGEPVYESDDTPEDNGVEFEEEAPRETPSASPAENVVASPKMAILPLVFMVLIILSFVGAVVLCSLFGTTNSEGVFSTGLIGSTAIDVCIALGAAQFIVVLVRSIKEKNRGVRPSIILIIATAVLLVGASLSALLFISPSVLVSIPFLAVSIPLEIIAFVQWKRAAKKDK